MEIRWLKRINDSPVLQFREYETRHDGTVDGIDHHDGWWGDWQIVPTVHEVDEQK